MSVIAAVCGGTRAYMAADSRLTLDGLMLRQHPSAMQKCSRLHNGLLVGLAGYSGLTAALLESLSNEMVWPDLTPWESENPEGFECYLEERGAELRQFMTEWATKSPQGVEDTDDFEMLIACGHTVARMTSDGGVTLHALPYFAIGSGQAVALGAAGALLAVGTPSAVAVRLAVEMACRHVPECGEPVVLVCSDIEEDL